MDGEMPRAPRLKPFSFARCPIVFQQTARLVCSLGAIRGEFNLLRRAANGARAPFEPPGFVAPSGFSQEAGIVAEARHEAAMLTAPGPFQLVEGPPEKLLGQVITLLAFVENGQVLQGVRQAGVMVSPGFLLDSQGPQEEWLSFAVLALTGVERRQV